MPQRKHYTASEKLAIQFVLKELRNPRSAWPDTHWCNFDWFDDIVSENLEVTGRLDDLYEGIRRVVKFYLGSDLVVELTLTGQRYIEPYEGKRFPAWAVTNVSYETDWKTGHESTHVERELMGAWLTGSYAEE